MSHVESLAKLLEEIYSPKWELVVGYYTRYLFGSTFFVRTDEVETGTRMFLRVALGKVFWEVLRTINNGVKI